MSIKILVINLIIKKTEILKSISIDFEKGRIHGLIGRNGSGKTMLMKCICGFVKPTNGTIIVDGKQIGKDCDFPENAGIIIETPGFIPYYSGYKNLKLLADLNKKINSDKIKESMRQVGLDPNLKRHVKKYSLGMKQRLGLAQAIMENPDLLILDEPMNGLDKDGVADMRKYLLNLKKQGKTILIASHSAEDIEILCDTVCEMDKGVLTKLR
jgi:ABC-2 type transport system ATP-binding protein